MTQIPFEQVRKSIAESFEFVDPPERPVGVFANSFFGHRENAPISHVTSWQQLTLDVLDDGPHGRLGGLLSTLRGATWRHYLPAWLLIGLDASPRNLELAAIALLQLWPEQPGPWKRKEFDERTDGLTVEQRRAIGLWVQAMLSLEPGPLAWTRNSDAVRSGLHRAWVSKLPAD